MPTRTIQSRVQPFAWAHPGAGAMWIGLVLLIAAFGSPLSSFAKGKKDPEVVVVTDVAAGRDRDAATPLPSAADPCFYIFMGGKEFSLGDSSSNEQMPERSDVQVALVELLKQQHYIKTEVGGPIPSLAIVCSWGEANIVTDEWESEMEDREGEIESVTEYVSYNLAEMRRLVGLHKEGVRSLSLSEQDKVYDALREDRLYLGVIALDVAALRNGKMKLVWRTRMSIPSRRRSLRDDFAIMLASGAPYFGRDTDAPMIVDDNARRAQVEVGEATVIEQDYHPPEKSRDQ